MKKIFAALAATAIMAFSVVPAFASVETGSSDIAVYSVIALSLTACGAASVALAKSRK